PPVEEEEQPMPVFPLPVEEEEQPMPVFPPPAEEEEQPLPVFPPPVEEEEQPMPVFPPPVEEEEQPMPIIPPPVEEEEQPLPIIPPPVEEEEQPMPIIPPPVEEEEQPMPVFPPPVEEEEQPMPIIPPPVGDEDELPPALPEPRKKGTGVAVLLGVAAFIAAAVGFQIQGRVIEQEKEQADLNTQIAKANDRLNCALEELREMEKTEKLIAESESRYKELREESQTLQNEHNELNYYSATGQLERDLSRLQDSITVLEQQSAEYDRLLELYLTPSELPEEKLKQRDTDLLKMAALYTEARRKGAWNILRFMYADNIAHPKSGNSPRRASNVLQAQRTSDTAFSYKLSAVGYSGVKVELILKSEADNSVLKEIWTLNEAGRISRIKEEVGSSDRQSLSEGFRNITIPTAK
ncbi:MAG: hypothetical protein IJB00_03390, partial [Akkermansia sp.]|nr:hypothetical protein [Akkermansia sp.]